MFLQEDSLATDNFLVDYFNEFLSLPVSVLLCSIEYIIKANIVKIGLYYETNLLGLIFFKSLQFTNPSLWTLSKTIHRTHAPLMLPFLVSKSFSIIYEISVQI